MIYQKIQEIKLNFQIIIQLSKSILKHSPWFEISIVLFLDAHTQRVIKELSIFYISTNLGETVIESIGLYGYVLVTSIT